MSKKVIAAIDLGSHALSMKIGEINRSGDFNELENYRKIALLGHETFTQGRISFETVDEICELLTLFGKSFKDYGVSEYEAVATSALREAMNRDYIVDQIKIKTGLDIRVISNSQEQFLTYKAIKDNMQNYDEIISEGAVFVVVGAGSLQVTTYKDGEIQSSQSAKMGALRIHEAFQKIQSDTINYIDVLDEYITASLEGLDFFTDDKKYKHLIALGGEIGMISNMIEEIYGEKFDILSMERFNEFFGKIKEMSYEEIEETFDISQKRAKIILPSMILFQKFMSRVSSSEILTPEISLVDGVIRHIYDKMANKEMSQDNISNTVANARIFAKKYRHNERHCNKVEEHALFLFDRLKHIHGMKEERVMLQIAAILHDIGKIISVDNHSLHTSKIIQSLDIFGLSKEQTNFIANVTFYHTYLKPEEFNDGYSGLPLSERTKIAKCAALLRLADALDRSHTGKITLERVKARNKQLNIHGVCDVNKDTTLEEWTFKRKADFFEEVFGITPVLKIKKEFSS